MLLLDTSVLIDVLRGSRVASAWLGSVEELPLCSELTRAEVLRGIGSAERSRTERLLRSLRWVAVDEPISRRAGELARQYRRSHPGLGIVDFVIGATAQLLGADLATGNVRHYPMFARLKPPYGD
jgi:predicted nucleic acid-binding protein